MIAPRTLAMLREKAACGDGYVVSVAAGDLRELLRAYDAQHPQHRPQPHWNTYRRPTMPEDEP